MFQNKKSLHIPSLSAADVLGRILPERCLTREKTY